MVALPHLLLTRHISRCWGLCPCCFHQLPFYFPRSSPALLQPIRLLSPNTNTGLLQELSDTFTSDSGWRVQYTVMDLERIAQEVEFQMKTSGEDAAVRPGSSLGCNTGSPKVEASRWARGRYRLTVEA